jgi:FtsP/CotA-like multicopper oxidase with cupredoxin domain
MLLILKNSSYIVEISFIMNLKKQAKVLLIGLSFFGCKDTARQETYDLDFFRSRNIICGTNTSVNSNAEIALLASNTTLSLEIDHPRYLSAGEESGLESIIPNDNRVSAGTEQDGLLELDLEVKWGDFRMETPDRPGLRIVAVGEVGKQLSIPSPLIRVTEGTKIRAKVTNTLADSTITVFGLQKRPYTISDSLFIPPGESREVMFETGTAGTYMYWLKLGKGHKKGFFEDEDEQLAGAFVVDSKDGSPKDRIFVMNIFSNKNEDEEALPEGLESLTINGRSWPFTERIRPSVGDTLNWRVINASQRNHPMHLHGFYFNVLERGNVKGSNIFSDDQSPLVVTETMRGRTTMALQWVPKRPGNWLFHCHLSFHVSSEIRLPGAENADPEGAHQHMAGLVLGIQVKDGESDLISKGNSRKMTLFANEAEENNVSFDLENKSPVETFKPGPLLILKQYQTTHITVKNQMSLPTSVHWHGLEIDSWSDGVPNWSSSEGRTSPIIEPGNEFTYKLSLMRPGTFVYHSHLDDINQLTKGLYGPMIVIGENEVYNPDLDHFFIMGWKNTFPKTEEQLDLNGWDEIPVQKAKIGETHRLRLINIAPAGNGWIRVTKDGEIIPIKTIAKDGADLPITQQKDVEVSQRIFVGETADFSFTPSEPGIYELKINYMMAKWVQKWEVSIE